MAPLSQQITKINYEPVCLTHITALRFCQNVSNMQKKTKKGLHKNDHQQSFKLVSAFGLCPQIPTWSLLIESAVPNLPFCPVTEFLKMVLSGVMQESHKSILAVATRHIDGRHKGYKTTQHPR